MTATKVWKSGEDAQPAFPAEFEVVQKAVLQATDIRSNHNKYYALELHAAPPAAKPAAKLPCRLFTHYGRTDDLETNPESGQKECRYFPTLAEAQAAYGSIYREVALASTKIGSAKARGTSAGEVDAKTLEKLRQAQRKKNESNGVVAAPVPARPALHPGVQELVRYLYAEATNSLTTTVAARITANGIETPLGVLTIGQVEKGEAILAQLLQLIQQTQQGGGNSSRQRNRFEELSGEFYSVIPHRIGRSRAEIATAVIDDLNAYAQKQETLQLMKDMLQVNGDAGGASVLYDAEVDAQYASLKCDLAWLDRDGPDYKQVASHVVDSQRRGRSIKVQNVFAVRRGEEHARFTESIGNQRLLFHGSRIPNWVGILSRGILLPKVVVKLGVGRTDAGWLGNGIYFGDAACTSCAYTSPGRRKTRFMAVARVALGNVKDYRKITYGLSAPPAGYHSCHGVRGSEFADDEYVIYDTAQHRMDYLVEFSA
jgi:poly [ADP-ribose] polymerase 2/3/4